MTMYIDERSADERNPWSANYIPRSSMEDYDTFGFGTSSDDPMSDNPVNWGPNGPRQVVEE